MLFVEQIAHGWSSHYKHTYPQSILSQNHRRSEKILGVEYQALKERFQTSCSRSISNLHCANTNFAMGALSREMTIMLNPTRSEIHARLLCHCSYSGEPILLAKTTISQHPCHPLQFSSTFTANLTISQRADNPDSRGPPFLIHTSIVPRPFSNRNHNEHLRNFLKIPNSMRELATGMHYLAPVLLGMLQPLS